MQPLWPLKSYRIDVHFLATYKTSLSPMHSWVLNEWKIFRKKWSIYEYNKNVLNESMKII